MLSPCASAEERRPDGRSPRGLSEARRAEFRSGPSGRVPQGSPKGRRTWVAFSWVTFFGETKEGNLLPGNPRRISATLRQSQDERRVYICGLTLCRLLISLFSALI